MGQPEDHSTLVVSDTTGHLAVYGTDVPSRRPDLHLESEEGHNGWGHSRRLVPGKRSSVCASRY